MTSFNSDILHHINDMPFEFRKKLNLPASISFGTEIEMANFDVIDAYRLVKKFNTKNDLSGNDLYLITDDISVDAEVVTPVMCDSYYHWDLFSKMYDELNSTAAIINNSTSSHVHIGTHVINSYDDLSLFIKTLVVFEPIIFMFGYGYGNAPRKNIKAITNGYNYASFATPFRVKQFTNALDNKSKIFKAYDKFLAKELKIKDNFNFECFNINDIGSKSLNYSINDHIEVRCFNGTLDKVISQNNINLIASIIIAVISHRIDKDYIEYEYNLFIKNDYNFDRAFSCLSLEECKCYNKILNSFSNIDINKAIKFADMIFKTDKDKYYFFKQYLKLFNKSEEEIQILKKKL